jgi:hypothetical protein
VAVIKMDEEYLEFLRKMINDKKTITPDGARVMLEYTIELSNELLGIHKQMSSKTSRITLEYIDELKRIIDKYKMEV